jgi:hypothetical protein
LKLYNRLTLLSIQKKKLAIQQTVLFKIINVVSKRTLCLDLSANLKINSVISKAYLVLAKAPDDNLYRQAELLLPPDIIDKKSEYKVKQILSDCLIYSKHKYLV